MNKKQRMKETKSTKKLGKLAAEYLKPENLIGPFYSTEDLMKSLWDENDENDEEQ